MDAHNLLFGDNLERCALYIVNQAYAENTPEAFQRAGHMLDGLRTFLVFLEVPGYPVLCEVSNGT